MSSYRCVLCGSNTMLYIWTSSRDFPRLKLAKIVNKIDTLSDEERKALDTYYRTQAGPVCFKCCRDKLDMNFYGKADNYPAWYNRE